jgi:hypothetical protein
MKTENITKILGIIQPDIDKISNSDYEKFLVVLLSNAG